MTVGVEVGGIAAIVDVPSDKNVDGTQVETKRVSRMPIKRLSFRFML